MSEPTCGTAASPPQTCGYADPQGKAAALPFCRARHGAGNTGAGQTTCLPCTSVSPFSNVGNNSKANMGKALTQSLVHNRCSINFTLMFSLLDPKNTWVTPDSQAAVCVSPCFPHCTPGPTGGQDSHRWRPHHVNKMVQASKPKPTHSQAQLHLPRASDGGGHRNSFYSRCWIASYLKYAVYTINVNYE